MPNLFLFTGENYQALSEKLKFWKREFIKKHGDMNLEEFEQIGQSDIQNILTSIESQPFLGEKRMTIIWDVPPAANVKKKLETESLEASLQNLSEQSLVIFVSAKPDKRGRLYKFLSKEGTHEHFEPLKGLQLKNWARERAKKLGKDIEPRALDLLLFFCAEQGSRIAGELEKLSLLSGAAISSAHVQQLVAPTPEAKIFSALDTLGKGSLAEVLKQFDQLRRSGEALPLIFFMIVRQFRILLQCRKLMDESVPKDVIQKRLKLAPFQVGLFMQQAKYFSFPVLKKAYQDLSQIDQLVKTGKIPFATGKEELFQLKIDQFFCSLYEHIN